MKKTILGSAILFGLALAACSSTSPTAEVIVVTATPEAVAPTAPPPTEVPAADCGANAGATETQRFSWPSSRLETDPVMGEHRLR